MGIVQHYSSEIKLNNHTLSVIFDTDSFFYSVSSSDKQLLEAVKFDFDDDLEQGIAKCLDEISEISEFNEVKIYSANNQFSFIPSSEYSYNVEKLFSRNSFRSFDQILSVDSSIIESVHVLHEYSAVFHELLSPIISKAKIRHLSLAWLSLIRTDGLFAYYEERKLTLLHRASGKLVFFNQYKIGSSSDALYFILLCYDLLKLDREDHKLYLNGSAEGLTKLTEELSDYIRHIVSFEVGFSNVKDREEFMDLYAATICE